MKIRLSMKNFRILLAVLLLGAFLGIPYRHAFACSCIGPPKADWAMQHYDAIFVGRVVDMVKNPAPVLPNREDETLIRLYASRVWKGSPQPLYIVSSYLSEPSCGVSFEIGRDFLVYARKSGNYLNTGLCDGTRGVEGVADQLADLGKDTVALDQSHPVWLPLVIIARDNTPLWNCRRDKVCARVTRYACQVMAVTVRAQLFCR